MSSEFSSGEDPDVEFWAERFRGSGESLKVRKIKLLIAFGLPIPETDVFTSKELDLLEEKILERRRLNPEAPMIIRFGCIPDQYSMPAIVLDPEIDIRQAMDRVRSYIEKMGQIRDIILQELTLESKADEKISGRLLLEKFDAYPREEVLELYKGARNTTVLNNVDASSPNFFHFEKKMGGFMNLDRITKAGSSVTESEIRDICRILFNFRNEFDFIKKVIARIKGVRPENLIVSFEFSYLKGRLVFSDIDY